MNGAMEVVVFFQAGRGNASACVWLRIFFALSLSSWPPPFARHAVAAPSGAVVAYFLYGVFCKCFAHGIPAHIQYLRIFLEEVHGAKVSTIVVCVFDQNDPIQLTFSTWIPMSLSCQAEFYSPVTDCLAQQRIKPRFVYVGELRDFFSLSLSLSVYLALFHSFL
jgi:hypothetical protein